jgi:hypothetical protein
VARAARGDPPTSPWMFYDSGGDYQGRHIRATVTFNGANQLTGASITRDDGCVYTKVLIGTLNSDGSPTGTVKTINMNNQTSRSFNQNQLNAVGLFTTSDILGFQITASP